MVGGRPSFICCFSFLFSGTLASSWPRILPSAREREETRKVVTRSKLMTFIVDVGVCSLRIIKKAICVHKRSSESSTKRFVNTRVKL